ncbi:MAG: hypothetical protein QOE35_486 [Actinomycetota bacterium]|jgi:FkbM family methyltransferase
MPRLRRGTFDEAIWMEVANEYSNLPAAFAPGEIVLDVGCHTGALCDLAARRGATVVGYEASQENYALAVMNLRGHASVRLHNSAVWRSDLRTDAALLFTPSADTANTGGGSVLYGSAEAHHAARPGEGHPSPSGVTLGSHPVRTVALDDVLTELGGVRYLKVDVEGAEFPILLTAARLDLVTAIGGEYHEFTDEQMAAIDPGARVGDERYSLELLLGRLRLEGFAVDHAPDRKGRGHFTAERG